MDDDLLDTLTDDARGAMLLHAEQEAPRECCGLLVRAADGGTLHYHAGRNVYAGTAGEDRFELDADAWVAAEEFGSVLAVVHSHPNASANPSMADRAGCEKSKVPWIVVGWPSCVMKLVDPCGWQAPYKGRTFHHGVMDCYTLIQDWYLREPDLGIALPDFERADDWWKTTSSAAAQDLYMQNFAAAGFVQVRGAPERHDVVLMQVMSDRANHGAVYLGNDVILHHLAGQLSGETVYGGYWARHTLALLRHQSRVARHAAAPQQAWAA